MNEISEAERAKIEREAREILERFSAALAKVKAGKKAEKKEAGGWREERRGVHGDEKFKERMLRNAPQHDENAVIAERKRW